MRDANLLDFTDKFVILITGAEEWNLIEKVSFSRYGKAFQEGLVQIIYEDRVKLDWKS